MTREEIELISIIEPYCFETNREEDWYKVGLVEGFDVAMNSLWKPADGDGLPEIDREVIALQGIVDPTATDSFCGYKVVFTHRPDPKGWDCKSITTGKVEHFTPKTYGKNDWNIPNVVMWLDLDIPKLEED